MSDLKQANVLNAIALPSDELKALIADHRDDLAQTRAVIELYSRHAERTHPRSITGGLLAAMAGEAANDPASATYHINNDVDYLSTSLDENVPHIDDVLAHPNWLSESAPQITQADMQLIFIKNLSEVLIQRMHSMDRFSEDDYAIGGNNLIPWDIVISPDDNKFGFITGYALDNSEFSLFFIGFFAEDTRLASAFYKSASEILSLNIRTITEDELTAFRTALEACYA